MSSDLPMPARRSGQGSRVPQQSTHATMSGAGPTSPEEGSALARLLRRQGATVRSGRLLEFVPAQVR